MAGPEPATTAPGDATTTTPLLTVEGIKVSYGRRPVLFDISLQVASGETVAIFGHNGAGKTTILKTIFGRLRPSGGRVLLDGRDINPTPSPARVRAGVTLIPAERFVFADLSVQDNLKLGAHRHRDERSEEEHMAEVFDIFPVLATRAKQLAGTLSGGQQRMLSIGIALMTGPRLLLLDEPSLGLAPALVEQMMTVIRRLVAERSLAVLLVEQNVVQTLGVVDRAYFIRSGRVILEQSAEELRRRDSYWDLF